MKKDVEVVVYRGTEQIGGCCTVIRYGEKSIAVDIGSELPGVEKKELVVPELMSSTASVKCEGLFLTHYHGDHIGEIDKVTPSIKVFASKATKQIMGLYQEHMGQHSPYYVSMDRITEIEYGKSVQVGEFRVTAIASDHSAIGSVMYLIEVGKKRILHTGDFRMHGLRRNVLIESLNFIGPIDLLITEGTTLTRVDDKEEWDEERVKKELIKYYKKYKYVFVLASSTNLDRLQLISEQVRRRRYFIVSRFQKELMDLAEELNECTFNKPLYYTQYLNSRMEKLGFVMLVSSNQVFEKCIRFYFEKYPQDSCLIYSMWSGYMEKDNIKRLCDIAGDNMYFAHSSGHVTVEDLKGLIEAIEPKRLLVIHTESTFKDYLDFDGKLINAQDGDIIIV